MEFNYSKERKIFEKYWAATYNPAKAIGAEAVVGSITEGKVADFIICNSDYTEKSVFLAGNKL